MGLGSEIQKKPIPDPGGAVVKKAPDPGSGSATLVTGPWDHKDSGKN
jgi:hypothetical protein